jgi:phage I-like protein
MGLFYANNGEAAVKKEHEPGLLIFHGMPDGQGVACLRDVVNAQHACAALCGQQGGGDAGSQSVFDLGAR